MAVQVRRNDVFTYHNRRRQPTTFRQQENFTDSCALYLLKLYCVLNEMWGMAMNTKIRTTPFPAKLCFIYCI